MTKPGQSQPQLHVRQVGPGAHDAQVDGDLSSRPAPTIDGLKLYEDPKNAFWRFSISIPLETYEARWEYDIPGFQFVEGNQQKHPWSFVVPSVDQSMRIMFHSCNGFSVGTDMNTWVGPNLWNDVLRLHAEKPFHVMIGGGDQVYSDSVGAEGPLKGWTSIHNPHKRRNYQFDERLRSECDDFYCANYARWYNQEPFKAANGQIPQVNVWDDHDIIDGFGSYTDHFMKCSVFRGIGGVAFKYYCLFQHHIAPPKSTFTTDAPNLAQPDPRQLQDTYVLDNQTEDECWIMGRRPGPYVEERSRSLYMRLGKRIGFVGLDARTERTRHQVNYPDTYDVVFARLEREIAASNGEMKHLIALLGVPIAYPRLAWLENLLTSPLIAPIRFLHRRFGVAGGFFNNFDGGVELLDDLDDHYTARAHKLERKHLSERIQELARRHSIRVTILSGDVHLSAVGRFYSKTKLGIHSENDPRYVANIVSSAITNKPPPAAVANLLARRNKIHHLDRRTDETLMPLFDKQPGGIEKGASWNQYTMPSRNFACITEVDGSTGDNGASGTFRLPKDGHSPLNKSEEHAGTSHLAADGINSRDGPNGGLNVAIRVEIDPQRTEAPTEGYGFSSKSPFAVMLDNQC